MKDAIGKGITNGIDAFKKKQEENKARKRLRNKRVLPQNKIISQTHI